MVWHLDIASLNDLHIYKKSKFLWRNPIIILLNNFMFYLKLILLILLTCGSDCLFSQVNLVSNWKKKQTKICIEMEERNSYRFEPIQKKKEISRKAITCKSRKRLNKIGGKYLSISKKKISSWTTVQLKILGLWPKRIKCINVINVKNTKLYIFVLGIIYEVLNRNNNRINLCYICHWFLHFAGNFIAQIFLCFHQRITIISSKITEE